MSGNTHQVSEGSKLQPRIKSSNQDRYGSDGPGTWTGGPVRPSSKSGQIFGRAAPSGPYMNWVFGLCVRPEAVLSF